MRRSKNNAVLNKAAATTNVKVVFSNISWYVACYTSIVEQQVGISKQVLVKAPTEPPYTERSVYMEEVSNQSLWTSELESDDKANVLIHFLVVFLPEKKCRVGGTRQ